MIEMIKPLTNLLTGLLNTAGAVTTLSGPLAALDPTGSACAVLWAAGLGLVSIEAYQRHREEGRNEALDDFLLSQMPMKEEVRRLFEEVEQAVEDASNRQLVGDQLGADFVARVETIHLSDLAPNDLRRPYVCLYRLLKGQFSSQGEQLQEVSRSLEATQLLIEEHKAWERELIVLLVREFAELKESIGLLDEQYREVIRDHRRLLGELARQGDESAVRHAEIVNRLDRVESKIEQSHSPRISLLLVAESHDPAANRFYFGTRRVPLFGRESEMRELRDFLLKPCSEPGGVDIWWWMWTAPGGTGKSRLALELCLEAEVLGFEAGFLDADGAPQRWSDWIVDHPTLIVVDYVSSRPIEVRNAIVSLRRHAENVTAPVRLLLLDRPFESVTAHETDSTEESRSVEAKRNSETASEDAAPGSFGHTREPGIGDPQNVQSWWSTFCGSGGDREALRLCAYRTDKWFRALGPLNDHALWETVNHVLTERGMHTIPDEQREQVLARLKDLDALARPLFGALAADAIADNEGNVTELRRWDTTHLSTHILNRELDRWKTVNVDESHLNLIAFATIAGRHPVEICTELHAAGLPVPPIEELRMGMLHAITGYNAGCHEAILDPLQPDILGELFVLERLAGNLRSDSSNPVLTRRSTLSVCRAANWMEPISTAAFLQRAATDHRAHHALLEFTHLRSDESFPSLSKASRYEDAFAQVMRAEVFHALGWTKNALQEFESAAGSSALVKRDLAVARIGSGNAKRDLGADDDALADYDAVIQSLDAPDELKSMALYNRSVIMRDLGDRQKEIVDLTAAGNFADIPCRQLARILINRGIASASVGDHQREIDDFNAVIHMDGLPGADKAEALYNRGVSRMRLDDPTGAICDFTSAIMIPDVRQHLRGQSLYNRGLCYGRVGDTKNEIADYTTVSDMKSVSPELRATALYDRGVTRKSLGDVDGALEDYSRVILMDNAPMDQVAKALYNRSGLYVQLMDHKRALDDYDILLRISDAPEYLKWAPLLNRGNLRAGQGDLNGAISDFTVVIESEVAPVAEKAQALAQRGLANRDKGDIDQAVYDLSQARHALGLSQHLWQQVVKALREITGAK